MTIRTQNPFSGLRRRSPAERSLPARLPKPAIREQGRGLPIGCVVSGLVQQPAPPQRLQVHNASPAPQRRCCGDLQSLRCRFRTGAPKASAPVDTIDSGLASAEGGEDQYATSRNRTRASYVVDGCLNRSRGIIFPGSHRFDVKGTL